MATTITTKYRYSASIEELGSFNAQVTGGNPLKGLVFDRSVTDSPDLPTSMVSFTVPWNVLMVADPIYGDEVAYDWTFLETALDEAAARGKQAVFRIVADYPGNPASIPQYLIEAGVQMFQYKPEGVKGARGYASPDYQDSRVLFAMESFIRAFGNKYDGDSRIAFLNLGLLGFWGHWSTDQYLFVAESTKQFVANWFLAAFPTTKLQVSFPSGFSDENLGWFDTFYTSRTLDGPSNGGIVDASFFWPSIDPSLWKRAVIGGEAAVTAFDDTFLKGTLGRQDVMECINTTHTSFVQYGMVLTEAEFPNAQLAHLAMGYNFVVGQVTAQESETAGMVDITVQITQVGVAPFYYPLSLKYECATESIELPGVETLVEEGESREFVFADINATEACLSEVRLSLASPNTLPDQAIRFAQGSVGTVQLSIPVPPERILDPVDVVDDTTTQRDPETAPLATTGGSISRGAGLGIGFGVVFAALLASVLVLFVRRFQCSGDTVNRKRRRDSENPAAVTIKEADTSLIDSPVSFEVTLPDSSMEDGIVVVD